MFFNNQNLVNNGNFDITSTGFEDLSGAAVTALGSNLTDVTSNTLDRFDTADAEDIFEGITVDPDGTLNFPFLNSNDGSFPLLADRTNPALDGGVNKQAVDANGDPLETDRDGDPRRTNDRVDIGASELQDDKTELPAPVTFTGEREITVISCKVGIDDDRGVVPILVFRVRVPVVVVDAEQHGIFVEQAAGLRPLDHPRPHLNTALCRPDMPHGRAAPSRGALDSDEQTRRLARDRVRVVAARLGHAGVHVGHNAARLAKRAGRSPVGTRERLCEPGVRVETGEQGDLRDVRVRPLEQVRGALQAAAADVLLGALVEDLAERPEADRHTEATAVLKQL